MKTIQSTILLLGVLLATVLTAAAQSTDEVRAQMRERLPEVDQMKLEGLVGENNQGFLEMRGNLSPRQRRVMTEENADRRQLYQIVARNAGVSVQDVGVQRALQIREHSAAGIWLQNPAGEWYQKEP